jgi:hypothetical protein
MERDGEDKTRGDTSFIGAVRPMLMLMPASLAKPLLLGFYLEHEVHMLLQLGRRFPNAACQLHLVSGSVHKAHLAQCELLVKLTLMRDYSKD